MPTLHTIFKESEEMFKKIAFDSDRTIHAGGSRINYIINHNKLSQLSIIDGIIEMIEGYEKFDKKIEDWSLNYCQALSDLKQQLLAQRELIANSK